jgi:succinate dehydrogenase/fumarate reductase flavoprotein subunit/uncharacterized protein with FMN-binding domain
MKKLLLGILLTAAFAAAYAGGSSSRSKGGDFLSSVSWDAEYDVVVVGFGGAGAVSAASAADAGAKVLLLEKAPEGAEGGNTRYSFQYVLIPKDRAAAITYFKAMRSAFENQSDEVIEYIVDGAMGNMSWFEKMGIPKDRLKPFPMLEYPELPGGKEGIAGYHIDGDISWNSKLWKFLRQLVMDRKDKIDVWYASPALKLLQDRNSRIIHGVVVQNKGKTYNVRAKNGVVLACGGFENDDAMLENFAQLPDAHSKGAKYNTGDGIRMALDAGADLWHMSALSGPDVNFIHPVSGLAQNYSFNSPAATPAPMNNFTGFGSTSMIMVGNNGKRFMKETDPGRHGHVNIGGSWISLSIPQNAWCVFDEAARLDRPAYPQWSKGMEEEIAKGWIIKADSIRELAAKMNVDPAGLNAQIEEYNGYCRAGKDPQYGVEAPFLKPLAKGPFYAFPVKASLTNTQGGPRRNTKCEVLDVWGSPIPHLYSAGELGSFYTDIYNGGGNLSECLFTGRTAGANAAAAKQDVPSANLLKGKAVDFRPEPLNVSLGPNEYLGTGSGMGTELVVKVKLEGGKISAIEYVRVHETVGISDKAIVNIPKAIISAQSTKVDTVTGATVTSKAIIQAVEDALSKAK